MTKEKWAKDKEFFVFCWEMLKGSEGYSTAAWFWAGGLTILFATFVLLSALAQELLT